MLDELTLNPIAKSPSETDLSLTQSIIRQSPFSVGSVSTGNKRAKNRRGRDGNRSMKMRDREEKVRETRRMWDIGRVGGTKERKSSRQRQRKGPYEGIQLEVTTFSCRFSPTGRGEARKLNQPFLFFFKLSKQLYVRRQKKKILYN